MLRMCALLIVTLGLQLSLVAKATPVVDEDACTCGTDQETGECLPCEED